MSINILLLEDDELFGETLEDFLSEEGYSVDRVTSSGDALEQSYYKRYDLYLFDVKLPDMSGFELLEDLRKRSDNTPTIFITSKNQKSDLKEGFLKGADDYLTKPVDLEELLLRIKALLKRSYGEEILWVGEKRIDLKRLVIDQGDEVIELNPKEAKLLGLLLKNRGKVVSKEMIYDHLWKPDEIISNGSLRVYIATLKKVFGKDAIKSIRGVGYRFEK